MKFRMSPKPQYEYDGQWRDAKITFIQVLVKDARPMFRPAMYTHLGPVISAPDPKTGIAFVGASPYFDAMGLSEQFYKMAMAKNVHDVYNALGMNQYNEQNVMFADDSGSIAYVRNGATPIRPDGYDSRHARAGARLPPRPGRASIRSTTWCTSLNPAAGYMQNCNISPQNMMVGSPLTPDKYPRYIYNVSWDYNNPGAASGSPTCSMPITASRRRTRKAVHDRREGHSGRHVESDTADGRVDRRQRWT